MKLKLISFLMCLLIGMQLLPLRQIGKVLASSQWTEELPHDADETGKDGSAKFSHPFLPPANYTTTVCLTTDSKALAYIHYSEQMPPNHSTEVVSPPPDRL